MHLNQKGTVRDGQHGTIVQKFNENFALFESDTGAKFTIIYAEFKPDRGIAESEQLRAFPVATFFAFHPPGEGFACRAIKGGGLALDSCPPAPEEPRPRRPVSLHAVDHSVNAGEIWRSVYHGITGEVSGSHEK